MGHLSSPARGLLLCSWPLAPRPCSCCMLGTWDIDMTRRQPRQPGLTTEQRLAPHRSRTVASELPPQPQIDPLSGTHHAPRSTCMCRLLTPLPPPPLPPSLHALILCPREGRHKIPHVSDR